MKFRWEALVTVLIISIAGCGAKGAVHKPPSTVPVSGHVTLNGKPLKAAKVIFIPTREEQGNECSGMTNDDGNYELQQPRGGAGAPPGDYKVVISHYIGPGGKEISREPGSPPPTDQGGFESLPPRYSNFASTQLKATVPPEGGEFSFELTGKK